MKNMKQFKLTFKLMAQEMLHTRYGYSNQMNGSSDWPIYPHPLVAEIVVCEVEH